MRAAGVPLSFEPPTLPPVRHPDPAGLLSQQIEAAEDQSLALRVWLVAWRLFVLSRYRAKT
jgi:hypothetical protein